MQFIGISVKRCLLKRTGGGGVNPSPTPQFFLTKQYPHKKNCTLSFENKIFAWRIFLMPMKHVPGISKVFVGTYNHVHVNGLT